MTALVGGPSSHTQDRAPAGAHHPHDRVPVRVPDTHLFGQMPGSGYVDPPFLVRRADGQVLQLTPLLYAVLDAVDGRRDLGEIATAASETCGRQLVVDDVASLVDKLRPLGLVVGRDGTTPELKKANPLLGLRPRFVVSKPTWTRRITAPFAVLFNPVLIVLTTLAFAAISYWVLFEQGLATAAYDAFTDPVMLLAVFAITMVSAGFHEFGHAAALRRGGGTPGAMGAGMYLVWPAFYTDVTDSYRLPKGARLRTDLGGLYFNALVSLVMFGAWAYTRWDGLLLVIAAQILQMVRQLPPIVRFDGYHILADVTGVPDLFHRIGPTLRSFLPRRWRSEKSRELKLWARVVVTLWVVLVIPILLVTAVLLVMALPRILATSWDAVQGEADQLGAHLDAGSFAGAGVDALAIAGLAVPVLGMLLIFVRLGWRLLRGLWRRTEGRPVRRTLGTALFAAGLAAVAYALAPGQGDYQPISPTERGTLQDALYRAAPVAATTMTDERALPASTLTEGEQLSGTTVWPSDLTTLPTRDEPVLAVVMTPRDRASQLPTWVFPFNRPDAPGPGDNQAMAVVTEDGGTAYDVAFALVWVDGDSQDVLNRNEAYAFASCVDCRALAVSFQVVLVVGEANIAAPENVAAAVAYNCVRCITEALAVQLVVSLPEALDADSARELEELWAEIAAFEDELVGLSLTEIQERLEAYEAEILEVVGVDEALANVAVSPSATPGASETSEGSSSADGTSSGVPSPRASSEPSASPSSSPATEVQPSATPSPTSSPAAGTG